MPSARLSFSTSHRVAHCLISTLRTTVSSLGPKKKCGTLGLRVRALLPSHHPAAPPATPPVPLGRQRPVIDARTQPIGGRLQPLTDKTGPCSKRSPTLHTVCPDRTLRCQTGAWASHDISHRGCRSGTCAALAVHHQVITARRMAPARVAQPSGRN